MTNGKAERVGIVGCRPHGLAMLKHSIKQATASPPATSGRSAAKRAADAAPKTATSPAELGKQCDFVILGVGYTDEVNAVVYGKDGLLDNARQGAIIAVSSTARPIVVQGDRRAPRKPKASACSTRRSAAAASRPTKARCWRWSAASRTWSSAAAPSTARSAPTIAHLGDVGHGQVGKTMNNLLLWVNARRPDRGRPARRDHRHRSRQAARRADDELGRLRRAQGMGHDLVHLGAQGHADRRRDDRQGRARRCRSPARSRSW